LVLRRGTFLDGRSGFYAFILRRSIPFLGLRSSGFTLSGFGACRTLWLYVGFRVGFGITYRRLVDLPHLVYDLAILIHHDESDRHLLGADKAHPRRDGAALTFLALGEFEHLVVYIARGLGESFPDAFDLRLAGVNASQWATDPMEFGIVGVE
jgi:hypothetical protein